MNKQVSITPYICYGAAIFLNFYWIFRRNSLSLSAQLVCLFLTIALITVGSFLGAIAHSGNTKRRYLRGGVWVLFVYYLYILSMLLFFGGLFHVYRNYTGSYNLVPFHTIDNYISFFRNTGAFVSISNLVGNMVILMPFGVFFPVLFPKLRRFWVFIPIMALIAIGVELLQWQTGTGVADIDDSILNFLGGVLAYVFTRCAQMLGTALK
ncbi:MAG: VanZ family protein [Eubacteriales bacterium]